MNDPSGNQEEARPEQAEVRRRDRAKDFYGIGEALVSWLWERTSWSLSTADPDYEYTALIFSLSWVR